MNLGDIKKDKPSKPEQGVQNYQDFSSFGAQGFNPFQFALLSQMTGMNNMGFNPAFGFPFGMDQSKAPSNSRPNHGHSNKKTYHQPMVTLEKYTDENAIREKFECLSEYNDGKFKTSKIKDADFFVIRSSNDDDFHKVGLFKAGREVRNLVELSEEQPRLPRGLPVQPPQRRKGPSGVPLLHCGQKRSVHWSGPDGL